MAKPEHNKVLTVPKPGKVEFVNRPYPRVKPQLGHCSFTATRFVPRRLRSKQNSQPDYNV